MQTATLITTPCKCPECGGQSEMANGEPLLCLDCTDYKMGRPDASDYD